MSQTSSQPLITTFTKDPLHSAAYLHGLRTYLASQEPTRDRTSNRAANAVRPFLFLYRLSGPRVQFPQIFYKPEDLHTPIESHDSSAELVYLSGYPSRQWLKKIVDRYAVDFRFLQNHLDFLPGAQREWYNNTYLPSRNQHYIRLLMPSIVFFETDIRDLSVGELHKARVSCQSQLKERARNFFGDSTICHGQPIVRRINVHTGDMMVLEQAVSICVDRFTSNFRVIVWSDAGNPEEPIPAPATKHFSRLSQKMDFCPVFFEARLQTTEESPPADVAPNVIPKTRQPLAVLSSRYGETLPRHQASRDPLMLLQELFRFQSSAASQYLNMLREITMERLAHTPPTGETLPSMDDILHFEYTKTVLSRWFAHFRTLRTALDDEILWTEADAQDQADYLRVKRGLEKDLKYLEGEAETLISLCDSGKSTIMDLSAVYESRQAAKDASLVTGLTKATNRITFIFLPISFVTSAFGMNFKQFGQGELSITIWLSVTLPLLIICIFLTERKTWMNFGRHKILGRGKAGHDKARRNKG